jgi:F-type H+-transporting ATPase subunit b
VPAWQTACRESNNNKQEHQPHYHFVPMEIAHQLGQLFLGAVPTVIIFLLFYVFMRWAFFTPIQKAMAERTALIEGARAEAAGVEAAAKKDLDAYREALKKARAEIYAEQEAARRAILEERAQLLKAMRSRSQEEVREAKRTISADSANARAQIESQTPALAADIARLILEKRPPVLREGVPQ